MAKFTQYATFIAVVETGSLSSAAKVLNITPSAVSKQLNALEETTKSQLLDRTNRNISITEPGKQFYERCKQILADVNQAEDELISEQEALTGMITITLSKSLVRSIIFDHLSAFSQENPKIRFSINFSEDMEDLNEKRIDFAFRMGNLDSAGNLYAIPLCDTALLFCVSPEYLKRNGKPDTFKDLSSHQFISPDYYSLPQEVRHYFKKHQLDLNNKNHHKTADIDAIYQSTLSGMCIGPILDISAQKDLEAGNLINLFPAEMMPSKKLYLVYKKSGRVSRKHQAFRDFVKESFRLQK